jgi:hypothetical protein
MAEPSGDKILVTIPSGDGFDDVAQLVLGGVAARLGLTFESLDDLGTALGTLLERAPEGSEVSVEFIVGEDMIVATVGSFSGDGVVHELAQPSEGFGLRRVLETVVDEFHVTERDDGHWIELEKRVAKAEPER